MGGAPAPQQHQARATQGRAPPPRMQQHLANPGWWGVHLTTNGAAEGGGGVNLAQGDMCR